MLSCALASPAAMAIPPRGNDTPPEGQTGRLPAPSPSLGTPFFQTAPVLLSAAGQCQITFPTNQGPLAGSLNACQAVGVRGQRPATPLARAGAPIAALRPPVYSPAAASCGASPPSAFCLPSRSSPVCWSMLFIDRRTLPRSSKPSSFTFGMWPKMAGWGKSGGVGWIHSMRQDLERSGFRHSRFHLPS